MPTSALLLFLLVASPAPAGPETPFTLALNVEASVIGQSYGLRPELLWRFGAPGTASRLRAAVGFLVGPELSFLPVSLGYRATYRDDRVVQPLVGFGYETQHFLIGDAMTVSRWFALYFEAGCGFAVSPRVSLGVATSVDVALFHEPGPGLQLRAFGGWRF